MSVHFDSIFRDDNTRDLAMLGLMSQGLLHVTEEAFLLSDWDPLALLKSWPDMMLETRVMGGFRVDFATFEQYKHRGMVLQQANDIPLSGNRELASLNLPVFQKLVETMGKSLGAEFIKTGDQLHTL